jgi:hypothetical protein
VRLSPWKFTDVSESRTSILIQAAHETFGVRAIELSVLFRVRKNFLSSGNSLLLCQSTRREVKLTVAIVEENYHVQFYPVSS